MSKTAAGAAKNPAPEGDQNNENPEVPEGKQADPPEGTPDDEEEEEEQPEDKGKQPTLAELLKTNPSLAAQHGKALAAAKKEAEAAAAKRLKEEAAESAKRANMAELDRVKAELKDAEDAKAKLEGRARAAEADRDIHKTLVESDVRLQEGALDILRDKVLAAVKDEDEPDYAAAVDKVLEKYPWMRASAKKEAEEAEDKGKEGGKGKPTGEAPRRPGKPGTQRPAEHAPQKTVDVMKMSPQEYAKHRREKGLT